MRGVHWPTLDLKGGIAVNPAHRKNPSEASVLYPGQIADAPLQFVEEIDLRLLVGITQCGEGNFRGQNVIGIEAGIDVFQPNETLEEQTGAGQEDEGEGHFRDDEDVAQPVVTPAGGGAASAFLERFGQVRFAAGKAGNKPEEKTGADRDGEGDEEDGAVDVHLAEARDGLGADRFHEVDRPDREENADARADNREHNAFRQGLAQQSPATGTDRDANRHLAFAGGGAGEHHGREIGAGDEEDERDRAEQDEKKRFHSADDLFLERINRGAEAVGLRIVILESGAHCADDRLEFGLGLLRRKRQARDARSRRSCASRAASFRHR